MTSSPSRIAAGWIVTLFAVASGPPAVAAPEPTDPEQVERLLAKADQLLERGRTERAADRYAEVDALTEGSSLQAHLGLAQAFYNLGRHDDAIERAETALELTRKPAPRARAENILGLARFARWTQGSEGSEDACSGRCIDLEQAAESFRAVLAITLQRLGQKPEAAALLRGFLEAGGAFPRANSTARNLLCFLERELYGESLSGRGMLLAVGLGLTPPRKLASLAPAYTEAARQARIQGEVRLLAIIDEEGYVGCVEVLDGLPMGLSQAAERAVLSWRFEPAKLNDEPVAVYYHLSVRFELQ